MMKITLASVAAAAAMLMLTTAPLATPAKAQGVGGTIPTPQLASARAVSPSAHDSAAAW